MREIRISEREIWDEMTAFSTTTPYAVARNIALTTLLSAKAIRLKSRSLFGQKEPEIDEPFELCWEPSTASFIIRQSQQLGEKT